MPIFIVILSVKGFHLCGMALIFFVVQRADSSPRVTRYGLYLATCVPLFMLIGLVALSFVALPRFLDAFASNSVSYMISQIFLFVVMVATLVVTLVSLRKGFLVRKEMLTAR